MVEHADMGGHGHRFDLVMGDIEEGRTKVGLDVLEFNAQVGAKFGVEGTEGFVHQVDGGISDKGTTDRDALHLAT